MSDPLLKAAQDEYQALKKRLADLERKFQTDSDQIENRMGELEEFFRLAKTVSPAVKAPEQPAPRRFFRKGAVNTKAAVIALAEKLLAGGKKMPTRQIMALADEQDIKVGGKTEKNRVTNMSAILGRSGRFQASAEGWTLKAEQLELPTKGEGRTARTVRPSVAA